MSVPNIPYCSSTGNSDHTPVLYTVEPPNKGHFGTQASVSYSEVVLYSEVFGKIVFLHLRPWHDVTPLKKLVSNF